MPKHKVVVNTFEEYQDEKQSAREHLIRTRLQEINESGAHFKYLTDLAKSVATYVAEAQKKPCSHTTLLRNGRYKSLLQSHQKNDVPRGAKNAVINTELDPTTAAVITGLQLANRRLEADNRRLKIHLSVIENASTQVGTLPASSTQPQLSDFEEKFIVTCQLIQRLIRHLDGIVKVDLDLYKLFDCVPRPHTVIADERFVTPYAKWVISTSKG